MARAADVPLAAANDVHYHVPTRRPLHDVLTAVVAAGESYGRGDTYEGLRVNLEFVSVNPTGPLHAGHRVHGNKIGLFQQHTSAAAGQA